MPNTRFCLNFATHIAGGFDLVSYNFPYITPRLWWDMSKYFKPRIKKCFIECPWDTQWSIRGKLYPGRLPSWLAIFPEQNRHSFWKEKFKSKILLNSNEKCNKNLLTNNMNSKSNWSRNSITSHMISKSTWPNYLYLSYNK